MTVYVDVLMHHGWIMRGRRVRSCHMFADTLEELHEMATKIGMKRSWFQNKKRLPHYDLTKSRRDAALRHGAVECDPEFLARRMYENLGLDWDKDRPRKRSQNTT